MLHRKLMALGLLTTIAACAAPAAEAPAADPAADQAAISAIRDGYMAAFKAGDAAAVAGYLTADAYDMENGMPTMVGAAAVQEGLGGMLTEMTVTDFVITSEKTEISGDLAYDRGTYKTTLTPKAAGAAPMTEEGRYLVVLKRQADGGWKLAELMGNLPTGAEMPATP